MAPPHQAYGHEHQQRRAELLPDAYNTECPVCGELMLKGQDLDLDHTVAKVLNSSSKGDRILHAKCNRSEGGKLGNRQVRFRPSRSW